MGVLLIVIANFVISFCVLGLQKLTTGYPLALRIPIRAVSVLYMAASLVVLLIAISFFQTLEVSDSSRECWKRRYHWSEIKIGMTEQQVVQILGQPKDKDIWSNDDERYHYDLHPLDLVSINAVLFNVDKAQPAGEKKVVDKYPTDEELSARLEWIPDKRTYLYSTYVSTISDTANGITFFGIMLLALLAFVPDGFRGDLYSWTLYTPLVALMFGVIYEKGVTAGWRFDWFILFPAYALILLGWLVRLIIAVMVRLR